MRVGGQTPCCVWCGQPLSGRQEVACNDIHKLKAWRWRHKIPAGLAGIERPPTGSPLLGGGVGPRSASECRSYGRNGGSRVSNGGLQVSLRRAVRRVEWGLRYELNVPAGRAEAMAELWMQDVLPARQRERLGGG